MFTHHKLNVDLKAVAFAAAAGTLAASWGRRHAIADQIRRASESVVINIAEASRLSAGAAKIRTLEYSIGSSLECAACLDIASIKEKLSVQEAHCEKGHLWEITRMLIGLRRTWLKSTIEDQHGEYRIETPQSEKLFHHESLDVYRVGLEFVRWFVALPNGRDLTDRLHREVDQAATSVLLNIAEGNGRYSELDHHRFLDMAAASAVKAAAYLDLCQEANPNDPMDLAYGNEMLGRIMAMLSEF